MILEAISVAPGVVDTPGGRLPARTIIKSSARRTQGDTELPGAHSGWDNLLHRMSMKKIREKLLQPGGAERLDNVAVRLKPNLDFSAIL